MKLLIIGIVASGKTTLAKRLSLEKGIKYFEIDSIIHDDINNVKRTHGEQEDIIRSIDRNNESWIIEGTLRSHMDYLLEMADKIILIEIPLAVRKKRIILRYIKQKFKIEKSNYKPSLKMLKLMFKWTNDYEKNKESMNERIYKHKNKLVILDSVNKIESFELH